MLAALFLPGTYSGILYRKNLKIEAKLLLTICILNVIPRRGNKEQVRYPEISVLYSLLNGSPRFPIRYLIMNHLWICRNKVGRSIIPYCRIIMGLLKQFKAITSEDRGAPKRHKPFEIQKMGIGWTYTQSERYHKLKLQGQRWRALKVDARDLISGEEDESESEAEEPRVVTRTMRMSLTVRMWMWAKGAQVGDMVVLSMTTRSAHTSRIGHTRVLCKRLLRTNVPRHPFLIHGLVRSVLSLITKR
ncbi:hypothetical protein HanRHA438_Chr01g0034051 [Helianthus annuus]|nr:hypothetical protein HanRHA438_Chr01g0034051 [Helianthus annuus]